jgi:predicted RNA-binding protein with PUA-like domain
VVATCTVVRGSYPDSTQYEKRSKYFDPKATKEAPRWFMVDIRLEKEFRNPVSLAEIKELPGLEEMEVARKGSRLSIQPVTPKEWKIVLKAGRPISAAG